MNKIYLIPKNIDAYDFLKTLSSEKHNIKKSEITVLRTRKGKPYFENLKDFHFNIAHSGDIQAVAISDSPVGVDIEIIKSPDLRVAKRFCKEEYDYIMSGNSTLRFFEIWTKKEAFLKYKGDGISGGLKICNTFSPEVPITTYNFDKFILSVCSEKNFEIVY